MLRRGLDGFARERLRPIPSLAPELVLIEIVRAQRVARLARRQNHARLVPVADVENLAPRRDLPRRKRPQPVLADAHHGRAVARRPAPDRG